MHTRGARCLPLVIALGATLLVGGLFEFEQALQPASSLELHEARGHVALEVVRGAGAVVAASPGPCDGQRIRIDAWLLGAVGQPFEVLPSSARACARAPDVRRRLLRHLKQHAHAGDDLTRA